MVEIMSKKNEDVKPINIKLDSETKNKFVTLAFLEGLSLQELGVKVIEDVINDNADAIAKAEELRTSFKK